MNDRLKNCLEYKEFGKIGKEKAKRIMNKKIYTESS